MLEEVRGPLLRLLGVHPLIKAFDYSLVHGCSSRDIPWTSVNCELNILAVLVFRYVFSPSCGVAVGHLGCGRLLTSNQPSRFGLL